MALISGGNLMLSDTSPTFARSTYFPQGGLSLFGQFSTYAAIYRKQVWVNIVVDKLAQNIARLPLKVYERDDENGRSEIRDSPFAQLIRNPNPKMDPFFFMQWTASTFFVYGEALWVKVRDGDGQPSELWPLHPANMKTSEDPDGGLLYEFYSGMDSTVPVMAIPSADIVHFKTYNPDTTQRGVSKLEPLRQTLFNEDAARRATASFWTRGARPAAALTYPGKLSDDAKKRLKARFEQVASGADATGSTVVLEEGMDAKIIGLNQEEAQYIQTRKLNREEVCAAYDIPPPAVHILDHATYSNITEQLRSVYRDTMAAKLGLFESTIDMSLRPDFDPKGVQYAEFLLDEVMRGDFETRAAAKVSLVSSAQMTPNEGRKLDNLPPMEGGDRLYINSAFIPIDEVSSRTSPNPPAEDVPGATPAVDEMPAGVAPVPRPSPNAAPPPAPVPAARSFDGGEWSAFLAGVNFASKAWDRPAESTETPAPPINVNISISDGAVKATFGDIEVPAAHVQVDAPVTVNVPPTRPVTRRVERDEAGNIAVITEEAADG